MHLSVHAANLLVAIVVGRKQWLHARAYTLGAYLVVYNTWFYELRAEFETAHWASDRVGLVLNAISLLAACVALVRWWVVRRRPA